MPSGTRPSIGRVVQTSGTVIAVPLRAVAGAVGGTIYWPDATTAATFAIRVCDFDELEVPLGSGSNLATEGSAFVASSDVRWVDTGAAIDAAPGGAAGAVTFDFSGLRHHRVALFISASANSSWDVRNGVQIV